MVVWLYQLKYAGTKSQTSVWLRTCSANSWNSFALKNKISEARCPKAADIPVPRHASSCNFSRKVDSQVSTVRIPTFPAFCIIACLFYNLKYWAPSMWHMRSVELIKIYNSPRCPFWLHGTIKRNILQEADIFHSITFTPFLNSWAIQIYTLTLVWYRKWMKYTFLFSGHKSKHNSRLRKKGPDLGELQSAIESIKQTQEDINRWEVTDVWAMTLIDAATLNT